MKFLLNLIVFLLVIPALPFLTLGIKLINILDDMDDKKEVMHD